MEKKNLKDFIEYAKTKEGHKKISNLIHSQIDYYFLEFCCSDYDKSKCSFNTANFDEDKFYQDMNEMPKIVKDLVKQRVNSPNEQPLNSFVKTKYGMDFFEYLIDSSLEDEIEYYFMRIANDLSDEDSL